MKQEFLIIINLRISLRIHSRTMITYSLSLMQVLKSISVSGIRREHKIIMKTIYYAMNVTFTTVKYLKHKASHILSLSLILFWLPEESLTHSFIYINYTSITISSGLKKFFNNNLSNTILFWDYPSDNKWPPYLLVDKELKFHKISPILPSKTL